MNSSHLMRNALFVPIILAAAWKLLSKSKIEKEFGPLKTAKKVNIQKYMGSWYVIANIPTFLETGAHNAIETYTWNKDKNHIDVNFTYNKDNFDGELIQIQQVAFIHNEKTNAEWRTQLYHTVKFPYVIMDLAHDYSYAVVGMPNREHVWILARNPTLEDDVYNTLKIKIADQGFDVSQLVKIPQTMLKH
ncbi:hypothetical protein CIK05_05025 [Bdellovibrio sp. qaytius]|nr:hypothetical protein CIK05_05025 [Bdellovibrio sp. qaytius]